MIKDIYVNLINYMFLWLEPHFLIKIKNLLILFNEHNRESIIRIKTSIEQFTRASEKYVNINIDSVNNLNMYSFETNDIIEQFIYNIQICFKINNSSDEIYYNIYSNYYLKHVTLIKINYNFEEWKQDFNNYIININSIIDKIIE